MSQLLGNVVPILFLILFGFILRRRNYFSDEVLQKISAMVGNLFIPCVIFNSILNLDLRTEHIALTVGFFAYQVVLLALSWLFYRVLKIKRKFFVFFSCAFSFGFMVLPLFTATFGSENLAYLVSLGIGQELFVALIFITAAQMSLKGDRMSAKTVAKHLGSPLFCMILAALILKFTGLKEILSATLLGKGLFDAIAKLGSISSILTLMIVGYRISFRDKGRMKESIGYVGFRYALTFIIGYALKWLVFDRIVAPNPYYDYAFFFLLSQHGSVLLTIYVGEYGTKEDLEVASNAFVINVIVGILLYVGYVFSIGAVI